MTKNKPKIFIFSAAPDGGEGLCYAMAQDGTVLGSHYCSHESFAPHDLGMDDRGWVERRDNYHRHYTGGYQMVFVPASQQATCPEFQRALEANRMQKQVADENRAASNANPNHFNQMESA